MSRNVHAEKLIPALMPREWSLSSEHAQSAIFLLVAGAAEMLLSDGKRTVVAPSFCWLPHGTAVTMRLSAGGSGYLLSLHDDVCVRICERSGDGLALAQTARRLAFADATAVRPILEELVVSFSAVTREARTLQRGSDTVIVAHLELIMLHSWRLAGSPAPLRETASGRSQTFERFSELVDQHFPEHWSIPKFAEMLDVTEHHLHAICMRETGRGPLAIVHGRLIETARMRLETSIVPIEQIAARLGFTDAGYFNRFFKKRVGVSPGAYRRRTIAQQLSERGEAFAAWP